MSDDKTFENKAIGIKMIELIDSIKENFQKEYGFEPTIINITNLIADRVRDNKLF